MTNITRVDLICGSLILVAAVLLVVSVALDQSYGAYAAGAVAVLTGIARLVAQNRAQRHGHPRAEMRSGTTGRVYPAPIKQDENRAIQTTFAEHL